MRRLVAAPLLLYLLVALASRLVEHLGGMLCECSADCWCKRPGLSVFRWVFPVGIEGLPVPKTLTSAAMPVSEVGPMRS